MYKISYAPLWNTLKQKEISQYRLIKYYKVSAGQISRLKNNVPSNINTLLMLCEILECRIQDVVEFVPDENDSPQE